MEIIDTPLPEVKLIRPRRHGDDRGWFEETFQANNFAAAGLPNNFVQENQSFSRRGVLRGLHYQLGQPQGKLVRVLSGHIWDVAVDIRRDSPNLGKWAGFHLRADEGQLLWIPEGFAHGFIVLSDNANVLYKTTRLYHPEGERCIRWNDPTLGIAWPQEISEPILSQKDAQGSTLSEADLADYFQDPTEVQR